MELFLGCGAQHTQDATRLKQRGPEPFSKLAKRCTTLDGMCLGDAIQIIRGHQRGVHGKGDRWRAIELIDLLSDITRDERDGRLPCGHHPLGFLDTLSAALPESFVRGNGAPLLDALLDIRGHEAAVSAHPALQIDKMVIVAQATDTRLERLALLRESHGLAAGRCEPVLGLCQTHGFLGGGPWTALCRRSLRAFWVALQPFMR